MTKTSYPKELAPEYWSRQSANITRQIANDAALKKKLEVLKAQFREIWRGEETKLNYKTLEEYRNTINYYTNIYPVKTSNFSHCLEDLRKYIRILEKKPADFWETDSAKLFFFDKIEEALFRLQGITDENAKEYYRVLKYGWGMHRSFCLRLRKDVECCRSFEQALANLEKNPSQTNLRNSLVAGKDFLDFIDFIYSENMKDGFSIKIIRDGLQHTTKQYWKSLFIHYSTLDGRYWDIEINKTIKKERNESRVEIDVIGAIVILSKKATQNIHIIQNFRKIVAPLINRTIETLDLFPG